MLLKYCSIIFPINKILPLPKIVGIANPLKHGSKTIIVPLVMPLTVSGKVTFQNVVKSVIPKSFDASNNEGSIFSKAV